jgi:electron transport complex protein RnfD
MTAGPSQVEAPAAPLVVSHWPHLAQPVTVATVMWSVAAALLPAAALAGWFFGIRAYMHVGLAVATAVGTEALIQRLLRKPVTVADGSAVVTGILLAFCLPAQARWFVPIVGAFVAIAIAKQCFGGLGANIWNPALIGRAFVHNSFPVDMNPATYPVLESGHFAANVGTVGGLPEGVHAVSGASPMKILSAIAHGQTPDVASALKTGLPSLWDMLLGNTGGDIGETSALVLLIGGAYLIYKGWVRWQVPLAYLATVAAGAFLYAVWGNAAIAEGGLAGRYVLYHLLGGGLMLGALFMATDMVTSPLSNKGLWIFGTGCGALTILIRLYGGYPEAVCYSILLANTTVPLIDRWTAPRIFGHKQ